MKLNVAAGEKSLDCYYIKYPNHPYASKNVELYF